MGRMMGDSIPWSAHPPTSRIPRAVKKEEKKENRERERETRVNWCCFTEGGDVKFSGTHRVQIRLRKLSATFPGLFIHGHRFYFQPRRTPSCVKRWNEGDRPLEMRAARSQGRRLRRRSRDYRLNVEKWATCFATRNAETRGRLSRCSLIRIYTYRIRDNEEKNI